MHTTAKFLSGLILISIFVLLFLPMEAKVDYPEIPKRPTLKELKFQVDESLNFSDEVDSEGSGNESKVKIKSFNSDQKYRQKLKQFTIVTDKKSDVLVEKSFNITSAQIFPLSLESIMSLNYSLKSFDAELGKIVAVDLNQNTLVVEFLKDDIKNIKKIKVRVSGYGSLIGKKHILNNANNFLNRLAVNIKKLN